MNREVMVASTIYPRNQLKKNIFNWILAASILLGLFNSFQVVFHGLQIDFDTSSIPVFWQNIHRYGWKFLLTIRYYSDGFQLSWMPIYFFFFWLLGPHPVVVVLVGWLAYVGCVAGVSLLVYTASRSIRSALVVAAILSFANPTTLLAIEGFLAFPIAHTISIFYGILAALCITFYITKRQIIWLVLVNVFLIADCVSDPWAITAILIPIFLASAIVLFKDKSLIALVCNIIALAIFVGIYQKTNGFGLFSDSVYPPVALFNKTSLIGNFRFIVNGISHFFNVSISCDQCSSAGLLTYIAPIAVFFIFLVCTIYAVCSTILDIRRLSVTELFCTIFFLASVIIGVLVYLVLFNYSAGANWSVRYFGMAFLFAPAYMALSFRKAPVFLRRAASFFVLLFLLLFSISTLSASTSLWHKHGLNIGRALAIRNFLSTHGLNYGYAGYFGGLANVISWISDGKILVRPIVFEDSSDRIKILSGGNISKIWYEPQDQTNGGKTFVLFTLDAFGDHCTSLVRCEAGLIKQFGSPAERMQFDADSVPYEVLVWNHPLLSKIDPSGREPAW